MAKIDKILGSVSPLYGMASGQGAFANLRKLSPAMHAMGETDTKAEKRRKRAGDAEEGATAMRKGGKVMSPKEAVHKHERAMHKGKPLTKMAKGGKVTRADGCVKKGHTKGKMV
jgi:hypothetical protein